ncbi:hypothetical protein F5Y16DRAFT_389090 [Xylariaceae sp. FL0255]|nr:hypothetical protein F5Y16DRAFT_389090 [Xylariaceae sp. FL0255]
MGGSLKMIIKDRSRLLVVILPSSLLLAWKPLHPSWNRFHRTRLIGRRTKGVEDRNIDGPLKRDHAVDLREPGCLRSAYMKFGYGINIGQGNSSRDDIRIYRVRRVRDVIGSSISCELVLSSWDPGNGTPSLPAVTTQAAVDFLDTVHGFLLKCLLAIILADQGTMGTERDTRDLSTR